jgi:hypothetical protein
MTADQLAATQRKVEKVEAETSDTPTEGKAQGSDEFDAMRSGILGKVNEKTEKAIAPKPFRRPAN